MATSCRVCVGLVQRRSCIYGGSGLAKLWKNAVITYQARGLKGKAEKKSGSENASSRGSGPPQANMEVCEGANIYKTGSDPEIKEDSAYPDWLWGIAEPPPTYTQLSPDTKRYWRRLNKTKAHERNLLKKQSAGR